MAKLPLRSAHAFWVLLVGLCGPAIPSYAQVDTVSSNHKIVDPVELAPFELVRKKLHTALPAAMQRKGITGFAGVEVAITPDVAYRLIRVLKIKVTEPGHPVRGLARLHGEVDSLHGAVRALLPARGRVCATCGVVPTHRPRARSAHHLHDLPGSLQVARASSIGY